MSVLSIKRIYNQFKYIYGIQAWHGPTIKKVLEDIDEKMALKSFNGSHNIAELVHHMTAWRIFGIKKLEGDETYDVSPEENFVKIDNLDKEGWEVLKQNLEKSQNRLLELFKENEDSVLEKIVSPRSYNFYVLFQGILQHDIYHLGQIVLLKK